MTGKLTVCDQFALHDLVNEIVWRTDHGQAGTTWELWTEDGELWFDGAPFRRGHSELREWGMTRIAPDRIRHVVLNLRLLAQGADAATGSGVEVVFYAPQRRNGPETTLPLLVGEWDFRFARAAARWRFARIHFRRLFDRNENPAALA